MFVQQPLLFSNTWRTGHPPLSQGLDMTFINLFENRQAGRFGEGVPCNSPFPFSWAWDELVVAQTSHRGYEAIVVEQT